MADVISLIVLIHKLYMRHARVLISKHEACHLKQSGLNNFLQKILCYDKRWKVNILQPF